tara:strand:- start:15 stop:467 length:453 start_codon:yes stop_codon:yes gene_type:complete
LTETSHTAGRAYIHQKCQQSTVISGDDWIGLCNPFTQTSATICSHCNNEFPVNEFEWADTHENVMTYIRRIRRHVPFFWRLWFWWLGPLTGAAIIAILLYFVGPLFPMKEQLPAAGWAAIGAFFGIFLMPFAVTPWLIPKVTGIAFHKQP